jgi:N-acetylmuramoyl-L-alanine amidase
MFACMKPPILIACVLLFGALTAFRFGDRQADGAREAAVAVTSPQYAVWKRPPGQLRIALQAGHWKAAEAPDEQAGLRTNGTRGGGKAEWEVNLAIARKTAALLEAEGYAVEILPTTIPPGYWADVFVSIHADGNANSSVSGYRAAAPRRDRTGRAAELADLLTSTYGEATGLPHYPTITRRMRSYYAFNSRRYDHALHPMTVGVILETGFLTSPRDRRVIVDGQDRAARGIADAVIAFLEPAAAATARQRDPSP